MLNIEHQGELITELRNRKGKADRLGSAVNAKMETSLRWSRFGIVCRFLVVALVLYLVAKDGILSSPTEKTLSDADVRVMEQRWMSYRRAHPEEARILESDASGYLGLDDVYNNMNSSSKAFFDVAVPRALKQLREKEWSWPIWLSSLLPYRITFTDRLTGDRHGLSDVQTTVFKKIISRELTRKKDAWDGASSQRRPRRRRDEK